MLCFFPSARCGGGGGIFQPFLTPVTTSSVVSCRVGWAWVYPTPLLALCAPLSPARGLGIAEIHCMHFRRPSLFMCVDIGTSPVPRSRHAPPLPGRHRLGPSAGQDEKVKLWGPGRGHPRDPWLLDGLARQMSRCMVHNHQIPLQAIRFVFFS